MVLRLAWCLVDAASVSTDLQRAGIAVKSWEPFAWELSSWLSWSLVTPVLLWWFHEVRRRVSSWPELVVRLALASLICSAAHVGLMIGQRLAIYRLAGSSYEFGPLFDGFIYEYRKDALSVCLMIGMTYLWPKPQSAPEPAGAAAEPVFLVPDKQGDIVVRATEIDWVEAQGNYVALHVGGQQRLLRQSMKEIEEKLRHAAFLRSHRSAIVNLKRVTAISKTELGEIRAEFAGRCSAPVSLSRRAELAKSLEKV